MIAVEKESKADHAGIKAGDEIVSVGGISIQNDLATFAADYARAKKIATENEVSTYPDDASGPKAKATHAPDQYPDAAEDQGRADGRVFRARSRRTAPS